MNLSRSGIAATMIGKLFPVTTFRANAIHFPGLAQLAACPSIAGFTALVMHPWISLASARFDSAAADPGNRLPGRCRRIVVGGRPPVMLGHVI